MAEFEKITLNPERTRLPQENDTMATRRRIKIPRKVLVILAIFVVFLLVSVFAVVLPAQKTYQSAKKTQAQAKLTYEAAKKQNVVLAGEELEKTKKSLEETQTNLHAMAYLAYIPLINGYYNDADSMMKAGFHGIKAGEILIDSVEPYADILGLKGQGSFVMGSAEQRIQTAVMTMGKITPRIDDINDTIAAAEAEIHKVNPDRYPTFLVGEKLHAQLEQLKTLSADGAKFVSQARPLIKVLPTLLGENKEKKYLVLFQNDKELRPTGGFITAYAIFKIDKGIIRVDRSEDIYELDESIRSKPKAPAPILKYLPKVSTFNLRDSNLSPDFVTSMDTFNSLYNKAGKKVDVDGIIALDTYVLVSTIKILDDEVKAGGLTFNTKEDKRCDCPQVIYELEDNISRPVNYIKEDRKGLLGQLLYALMEKALKSSPKIYWGPLFQDMITQINQKHVMFYVYNKDAQAGIESLNAAGRIHPFEGDYLHINQANLGGQKSNLFVKEEVEQNIEVGKDGTLTKTVTITYKNNHPPSDCNLERGALCLNATLRDWIRVYVPKGSQLVSSQGSEVKVTTAEEFNKTYFDGFLTVRPLGKATYTLKYTLPFKLTSGSPLPLLIQKQPGTGGHEYAVKLNGKTVQKFPLLTDKELKLNP